MLYVKNTGIISKESFCGEKGKQGINTNIHTRWHYHNAFLLCSKHRSGNSSNG